ncbi:MAG: carboxymuconolactone decarboxylase family protein [Streptomycetaceae bacterium]|nr:carboxymuconolactone decarboxylase family protein [Streptomycetaceae bacterium]
MPQSHFPAHTVETAPEGARRTMKGSTAKFGYLPDGVARLAESPETLNAFLAISAAFEATTLDKLARETVIMTMATRNGCELCVAMHTAMLTRAGADPALIAALRDGTSLPDARLAAVRRFTLDVLAATGDVAPERVAEFLAHGFTARNALEVVMGIGAYTLSTLANRLTGAEVDAQLASFAWHPGAPAVTV